MPWFRQSSFGMSLARLKLPKQHTIATSDSVDAFVGGSGAGGGAGSDGGGSGRKGKKSSPAPSAEEEMKRIVSVTIILKVEWMMFLEAMALLHNQVLISTPFWC